MSLLIRENRPGYADTADVNGISIGIYPGANGKTCLVIPPYTLENESSDIDFTESELRQLSFAATWAADKLKEQRGLER